MSYRNLDELLGDSLIRVAAVGAIVRDSHFVYTSGKHGPHYINKDGIYPYANLTNDLCRVLAWRFRNDGVEVVLAPAVGAVILSTWMSYHLTNMSLRQVLGVYADKNGDDFVIKRGYEKLIPHRRILVIEDLFTTGGSVEKVVALARGMDGEVIGVGGLANRGGVTAKEVGNVSRFETLMNIAMRAYEPADCPLCKAGVPINTSLGHGKNFLAAQQK